MMLLDLLLSTLLALSSAAPQDFDKREEQRNVSSLSPDLEDEVPKITTNISVFTSRRFLRSVIGSSRTQSPIDQSKLKWKAYGKNHLGSLPNGSVSIYNKDAKRTEFVCRFRCQSGFYSESEGPQCHVADGDTEIKSRDFEILVNEDNFENLEWKDSSYGSVPRNSVRTCAGKEIYVGRNRFGLGKVHPKQQCFFLPWGGSQYWYRSYQVLTINNDVESNFMTDIRYNIDDAKIVSYAPETMRTSAVINNNCNQATKSATLKKTIQEQKRWDISSSITLGVKTALSVGIPNIVDNTVQVSAATTFQASGGHSRTEEISHSVSVNVPVPPNHSCRVRMVGYKYESDIPFTARFRRTYKNGKTAWTSISGTYHSVEVGEVQAVVDRCKPVDNASHCLNSNIESVNTPSRISSIGTTPGDQYSLAFLTCYMFLICILI